MNKFRISSVPLAVAMLSAHAASAYSRTDFDAAPPTMKTGVCYIDDGSGDSGGGEGKTTVALGQNVDDAQKQQQAEASDTRQVGAAQSDIKDDAGTLGSEGKAAIGDPLAERQSE